MYGPIQFSVIGFDNNNILEGLMYELDVVREFGIIRLIDMLIVSKDKFGNLFTLEVSDYTDEERMEFGALIGALIGLGAAGEEGIELGAEAGILHVAENDFGIFGEDLREVVEDIPEGTSAVVVLYEHTWALGVKSYVAQHGGFLVAQGMLHPETFIATGVLLAEAIEQATAIEEEELKEEDKKSVKGTSTKEIKEKSTTSKKSRKKTTKK